MSTASVVTEVTSWRGGQYLGTIPVGAGTVEESATGDWLGRVNITVPATDQWIPTHPGHALAPFGQELLVRRGRRSSSGNSVDMRILGRFLITDSIPDGDWISVQGDSVDTRLTGARWITDKLTSGRLSEQAHAICAGVVPLRITAPDRASSSRRWEAQSSRRDALIELCDAWGAVPRIVDGTLTIEPEPTSTTVTHTITAGRGGTLVDVRPVNDASSGRTPNAVVAMTVPDDETAPIFSMAHLKSGPRTFGGPYGQQITFFASPLLRTYPQVAAAADTRLRRLQSTTPEVTASIVTDPSIRLGSVVRVIRPSQNTDVTIRVTSITHALTAGREPGTIGGQVISGTIRGISW